MNQAHRSLPPLAATGPAVAIALAMTTAWTIAAWPSLTALALPDTDDMARLAQVRDWLGGQSFNDLTQYRLGGDGGLPMHWSRLPDLVPGAIIAVLTPVIGVHMAEVAAVIAAPALLFAVSLALIARIALRLGSGRSAGIIAVVLGALAYPMTAMFLPGKIDHHGFQIVMLLMAADAALGGPRGRGPPVAGLCIALSLAVGLENVLPLAVIPTLAGLAWIVRRADSERRLFGMGAGMAVGLAITTLLLRPRIWPADLCDSLTPALTLGAAAGAAAMILLPMLGKRLSQPMRMAAAGAAVLAMGAVLIGPGHACLAGPYGAVDPRLASLWLSHVAEAQPLMALPVGTAIGYGGVFVTGLIVALVRAVSLNRRRDRAMAALILAASVAAMIQARGSPSAAALALPVLAAMIADLRTRGDTARRVAGWLVSTGVFWTLIGGMIGGTGSGDEGAATRAIASDCATPAALAKAAALPPGRVIAPIDLSSHLLGATRHHVIAGAYHRNTDGNLAIIDYFHANPAAQRTIERDLGADYVIQCAGSNDLSIRQIGHTDQHR
ncbi:hypothetical protein NYR55_04690 [Sphingomonas sp. BGYR3]|uniref:hypothetical protein n=1 Tax=Sphingomonas sp. BGYR3 TaxID=2975483 RepID=UPI0021A602F1|nr:hypothetical protein [Sphingomonas sp. BGYR3]MDG5487915.1 hypothetical protein [Sphingomonas sp. BGYR3]